MGVLKQYRSLGVAFFNGAIVIIDRKFTGGWAKFVKGEDDKKEGSNIKGVSDALDHYEHTIESSLKELRSCILCIISVWSLLCLIGVCLDLFCLLLWKNGFSGKMVSCLSSDHFYDRLYWGHKLSLYKIQKQPFKKVSWNTCFQIFKRTVAQVSFKYFVYWLLIIFYDFLEFLRLISQKQLF